MWDDLRKQLSVLEIFMILLVMVTYVIGFFIGFHQLNPDPWNPAFPYVVPLMILFAIFIVTSKLIKEYIDKDLQIVEYIICFTIRSISILGLLFYLLFFIALLYITKF